MAAGAAWLVGKVALGLTSGLDPSSMIRQRLLDTAPHMRLFLMGLILLMVMRFSPRGLIPERTVERR